jgi:hypothetical protein
MKPFWSDKAFAGPYGMLVDVAAVVYVKIAFVTPALSLAIP